MMVGQTALQKILFASNPISIVHCIARACKNLHLSVHAHMLLSYRVQAKLLVLPSTLLLVCAVCQCQLHHV